jgi:2-polyprenyl-3-methyl-5-hydroxy-6-metoxy-1,4-benzoquinol methylase
VNDERLDTAHEVWDRWWGDAQQRAEWDQPHPFVTAFIPELRARGSTRVLDVGGGIGRHAIAYAKAGFDVVMTDASTVGIAEALRVAKTVGVQVDARVAPFTALPVEDASVDHVLAWNVLYHGDRAVAAAGLSECRRVLRPGGTVQITMLSKRSSSYGVGREIRADTFLDDASTGDKDHPHFYVDAVGLCSLLSAVGFEAKEVVDVDQHPPGGWHWTVLAETAEISAADDPR